MSKLTTPVLDLVNGCPGQGIDIQLYRLDADDSTVRNLVASDTTNHDGRCDQPLLESDSFVNGQYEIVFHVGTYFDSLGVQQSEPKFLNQVVIRFGIADSKQHYHVPLLLSTYGYSTYRGS